MRNVPSKLGLRPGWGSGSSSSPWLLMIVLLWRIYSWLLRFCLTGDKLWSQNRNHCQPLPRLLVKGCGKGSLPGKGG